MQGQLDVMEADLRPWIKINSVSVSKDNIGIPDGLRFWRNETFPNGMKSVTTREGIAQFNIEVSVTNIGKAPAFDVEAGIWPLLGYAEDIDLANLERRNCGGLKPSLSLPMMADNDTPIRTVFPTENITLHPSLSILPDRIQKQFQLWFYGCVTYNIDPNRRRQTGFGYRVTQIIQMENQPTQRVDFDPGINVPANAILLNPRPMMAPETN